MAMKATAFNYHRAIVFKAHYPQRKRDPVEYEGVPPELWLHIFSDKPDLSGLTVVSKSFSLFQHIAIRPACGQHPTSGLLACRRSSLKRITERIQFSTQERIAHAVAMIEFSPTITRCSRHGNSDATALSSFEVVPVRAFPPAAATLAHYLRDGQSPLVPCHRLSFVQPVLRSRP